jgi:hypothetical protein
MQQLNENGCNADEDPESCRQLIVRCNLTGHFRSESRSQNVLDPGGSRFGTGRIQIWIRADPDLDPGGSRFGSAKLAVMQQDTAVM